MRIKIKAKHHNIYLVFPTKLLTGKLALTLAEKYGRRYAAEAMRNIQPQALEALCAEIRRIKEKHGTWELVDIQSAEGEEIYVSL